MPPARTRTVALTLAALVAFAGNSLLARAALLDGSIGAFEFTAVRVLSGALVLAPFLRGARLGRVELGSATALLVYALAFSLAYLALPAGTGALLLFGAVQVTMIGVGLARGERASRTRVLGFTAALAGLIWLVSPGVGAPTPWAAVAMSVSGLAWGAYTLLGRGGQNPTRAVAIAFALAAPIALVLALLLGDGRWSPRGLALAAASGAGTSGIGYAIWYAALRGHSAISASIVQLSVPALAALGGALLLGETLDLRLIGSGLLTLLGVAVAIVGGGRGGR